MGMVIVLLSAWALTAQPPAHRLPQVTLAARRAYPPVNEATATGTTLLNWPLLDTVDVQVNEQRRDATITYPKELKRCDGRRISIVGFMAPWQSVDDLSTFQLMPGYVGCYLCKPPSPTEVMLVRQKQAGHPWPFAADAVRVTGTLRLFTWESQHPAHQEDFMYALDEAEVHLYTGPDKPDRAKGD